MKTYEEFVFENDNIKKLSDKKLSNALEKSLKSDNIVESLIVEFDNYITEAKDITFELDVAWNENDNISNKEIISKTKKIAKSHNVEVIDSVEDGPSGFPLIYFMAPNEKAAFALVDALYGPEDNIRDDNNFFVYGNY